MLIDLIKKRQITSKLTLNEINLLKYIEKAKKRKICKEDHEFGYAPYVRDGPCRFCFGVTDKSLDQIIHQYKTKIFKN